ncbi:hypothetical protein CE91St56_13300 [Lachnospiraceae bacterium]|nr:hypothetical protein CE91St56_13300 [Lachnospiraceae bacterium]GKH40272.1 hypothetical protein CE91St57_12460 [Lachnospiraceae bacterium]
MEGAKLKILPKYQVYFINYLKGTPYNEEGEIWQSKTPPQATGHQT